MTASFHRFGDEFFPGTGDVRVSKGLADNRILVVFGEV